MSAGRGKSFFPAGGERKVFPVRPANFSRAPRNKMRKILPAAANFFTVPFSLFSFFLSFFLFFFFLSVSVCVAAGVSVGCTLPPPPLPTPAHPSPPIESVRFITARHQFFNFPPIFFCRLFLSFFLLVIWAELIKRSHAPRHRGRIRRIQSADDENAAGSSPAPESGSIPPHR